MGRRKKGSPMRLGDRSALTRREQQSLSKPKSPGGPITEHFIIRNPRDYDTMTIAEMTKPLSGRIIRGHALYTLGGGIRRSLDEAARKAKSSSKPAKV